MKRILGYTLCIAGSPALLTLTLGMVCHSNGPEDWAERLLFPVVLILGLAGLPFVPIMTAGLRLVE